MWFWLIGFLLHEMAFGLLSVFLPLYVTGSLGGSLTDFGIMVALANFAAVPFAFFWGYISDKTRRYRLFVLLSFSTITILLLAFSQITAIVVLIAIYAAIAIFHVAHEAPKNVLIAEYYSKPEWKKSYASYEALTELGWLGGLLLGFVLFGYGFNGTSVILIISLISLAAFISAFFTVRDPILIFERRLVAMERTLDFANHGFTLASQALDGTPIKERLRQENVYIFCAGLLFFSLATSIVFTPLPIFFSKSLQIPSNLVFGVFALNTFGSFLSYAVVKRKAQKLDGKAVIRRANLMRIIFPLFWLSTAVLVSVFALVLSIVALVAMGVAYAFFWISTLSLSMELIPEGKAGWFNTLVGLGGASGCFIGPYVAQILGFPILFVLGSSIFFLSYVAFKTYAP